MLIQIGTDPNAVLNEDVATLKQIMTSCFNTILAAFQSGKQLVWNNPHGLTPQQMLAAIGTDAATLFSYTNDTVALLNQALPDGQKITQVVPAGVVVTFNPDGTVTLANQAPTTIALTPAPAAIAVNAQQQFTAVVKDQQGNAMSAPVVWSASTGTIDQTGLYTAPATAGTDTVTATAGAAIATASVTFS
jgi:hypothetical protein